ncbi:MAG: PilN domain-containing protein [Bdellovibrionales bacterium]|nr:PilN domain-containing protein [Bdellovibrionales bacterium]
MIRINLIPTKAARKKETAIVQLGVALVGISFVCAVCLFQNYRIQKKIEAEQIEINEIQAELKKLQSVIAQVKKFKEEKKNLESKIDTIKKLNTQRTGPVRFLQEFSEILPTRTWITTFKEVEKKLTLEGESVDGPAITRFIDNMKESNFFSDVELKKVEQDKAEKDSTGKNQKFSVTATVNYAAGSRGL